jgi:hypothetical protein
MQLAHTKVCMGLLKGWCGPSRAYQQYQVVGQPYAIGRSALHWFWAIIGQYCEQGVHFPWDQVGPHEHTSIPIPTFEWAKVVNGLPISDELELAPSSQSVFVHRPLHWLTLWMGSSLLISSSWPTVTHKYLHTGLHIGQHYEWAPRFR